MDAITGEPMSRKLFAFLLSELNVVRVKCKHCGIVTELPTDEIYAKFQVPTCKYCGTNFAAADDKRNPFARLQSLVEAYRASNDVEIEFILPDHSDE